jgi:hypothetical protein
MNKPGWVTVIGILLVVMGCLGALGAWQTFNMPGVLAKQKQMIPQMQKNMEQQKDYSPQMRQQLNRMYERMMTVPSWFDLWCLLTGIIEILFSMAFVYTAISLFQFKKSAVEIFYWVLGSDIVFLFARTVIGALFMGWMGMFTAVTGALAGITDIILLIVVVNGKKEIFT